MILLAAIVFSDYVLVSLNSLFSVTFFCPRYSIVFIYYFLVKTFAFA